MRTKLRTLLFPYGIPCYKYILYKFKRRITEWASLKKFKLATWLYKHPFAFDNSSSLRFKGYGHFRLDFYYAYNKLPAHPKSYRMKDYLAWRSNWNAGHVYR